MIQIRQGNEQNIETLVELSLLAWEPVFDSFRHFLGDEVYPLVFPEGLKGQRATVENFCKPQENRSVWVAEIDNQIAGFMVLELRHQEATGEVQLLAVHPAHQKRGIAAALNTFALDKMRASGMKLAVVATGGDPGHAPARRSYEKAGYLPFPQVWYYQKLT